MATLSPPELLDWLGQFQFLSGAQIDELRPTLGTFADSHAFAKELIRRDWLTPFQVNQILQGKHEQLVVGNYRLRERIGEGAMGQIFKAVQVKLDRTVAVKMIHKQMISSEKAMERFRREVETASQLDHPNICRVRDAGDVAGLPYMVMDFIDGTNLSQRVKLNGALPIHEAVEYARQAAMGLQHAYERGIVHRDIKPANLIVTTLKYNDETLPLVKILDFGLARFESEQDDGNRLTQVGKMLGTIDYVSPEQATDARNADIRADIYSLGCTLYYTLTAQPPFTGKDVVERLGPRLTGEPPWIRTQRAEIHPGLEGVLRQMMARLPEDRYQTPIEAAQALEPYATPSSDSPGVAMALPVAEGAIAEGEFPMAMAMPTQPREEEPSFLEMTATGRDLSTGKGAATPVARKNRAFPVKLALIGSAAALVALVVCLGGCFFFFFQTPKKPEGIIKITKAKWSMGDGKAIPGENHAVLVWVERVKCKGKITVTLKDLPDGVVVREPLTLLPGEEKGQFGFKVSYGTGPLTKEVKLVAESESDNAFAELPMKLVIIKGDTRK